MTGLLVADGDEEVELAPGEGEPVVEESGEESDEDPDGEVEEEEEPDEADDDEEEAEEAEDVEGADVEDGEDVAVAKFHPLSCTPTTCVAPKIVLVSDQGPESPTVK